MVYKMTKKTDVSVIIPSYNVVSYIVQCLESVRNQTLENIEIICVDAKSTDGTLELIQDYAKKDSRFKVLISEKKSYGYQMNLGISIASGKYIGIVESDDWADTHMFEKLFIQAEKMSAEIVKANYYQYSTEHGIKDEYYEIFRNLPYNEIIDPDQFRNILLMSPSIWTGIYKKSFLNENDIYFLESPGASFQDTGFIIKCLICASRILLLKEAYLHYRVDNVHSSVKSESKVYCVCDEFYEVERFLNEKPELLKKYQQDLLAVQCERYCWNFYHISMDARFGFLQRMNCDFKRAQQSELLEEQYFSGYNWKFLQMVLDDPEKTYQYFCAEPIVSVILQQSGCSYKECIESLRQQTFKCIEIIQACGDDIIETISKAKGRYLIFIDKNVVYMPELLERGFKKAFETGAELVVINGKFESICDSVLEKEPVYLKNHLFVLKEAVFSAADELNDILSFTLPVLCNRIYSKEYLEKNNHSDLFQYGWNGFKYLSLYYASRIVCINKVLFSNKVLGDSAASIIARLLNSYDKIYDDFYKKIQVYEIEKSFYKSVMYAISAVIESAYFDFDRRNALQYLSNHSFMQKMMFVCDSNDCKDEELVRTWEGFRQALCMGNEIEQLNESKFAGIKMEYDIEKRPKVSVIVTSSNDGKYICNCLESIISQNLIEIEILCIDISWKDVFIQRLELYRKRNPRIKIIHLSGYKLAAAKNIAVQCAVGEYLLFIDSDDFLEKNALDSLYQKTVAEHLDLLLFQTKLYNESFEEDLSDQYSKYKKKYSGQALLEKFQKEGQYVLLNSRQLIYREYFINHELWLKPGMDYEDKIYTFTNIIQASGVRYIPEQFYLKRSAETEKLPKDFYQVYGCFLCYEALIKLSTNPEYPKVTRQYGVQLAEQILLKARTGWRLLDEIERFAFYGVPDGIRIRFRQLVVEWSDREDKLEAIQQCYQKEQRERLRLRKKLSVSYEDYQKQKERLLTVQQWHQNEWMERLRLREELSASYENYQNQKDKLISIQQWCERERKERLLLTDKLHQKNRELDGILAKIGHMQIEKIQSLLELAHVSGKKSAIWGCGKVGMKILKKMEQHQITVDYLIDQDLSKNHQEIYGYTVYAFDEVKDQVDIVLVTSHKYFSSIRAMAEGKVVIDLTG